MLVAFAVVVQADLHRRLFHGDYEQDLYLLINKPCLALLPVPKPFAGFGGAAGKRSPVIVFSVYPYCGRLGGSEGGLWLHYSFHLHSFLGVFESQVVVKFPVLLLSYFAENVQTHWLGVRAFLQRDCPESNFRSTPSQWPILDFLLPFATY